MQRRKFVVGLGSLAAGGAAAMGTGAFASVRAERTINVDTAGDASAYLAIDASGSVYAAQTGNTVELQFDGSNGGQNGDGLNARADTVFANVLRVENQGTNTIRLELGNDDGSPAIGDLYPNEDPGGPMAVYYSSSELDNPGVTNMIPFNASPAPSYHPSPNYSTQDLGPGDDLYIHFGFYLNHDLQSLGSNASTSLGDVPDDIGLYADATPDTDGL
ncbi:hypothetical protein [Halobellus sp. Atlit-38R]|uniref:hypothetical protein n=1 Tax=Halobellus sp. Atlit-38R TaxID=2282131 RepID=UPI0011C3FAC2|nr:hypothetical protein [Halobellus sp. Atlit-38R]